MSEWYDDDVENNDADLDEDDEYNGNIEPDDYELVWEVLGAESEWDDDDVDNPNSPSRQNPGYIAESEFEPELPDDVQDNEDLEEAPDGAMTLADIDGDDGEMEPVMLDCDVKVSGTSVDGGTCSVGATLSYSLSILPDADDGDDVTISLVLPANVTCASAVGGVVTFEETYEEGTPIAASVSAHVDSAGDTVSTCYAEYGDEHIDGWSCEVVANA